MKWYGAVGIALLGVGTAVAHFYPQIAVALVIFAGGVILTSYGLGGQSKKELTAKA